MNSSSPRTFAKGIALTAIGLAAVQGAPRLVRDITPNYGGDYSAPNSLTPAAGKMFFYSGDQASGLEPWCTDGTSAGTRLLLDILPGRGSSLPANLTAHPNGLFFTADDGVHGREWWWSDGTAAGTRLVSDAIPGLPSTVPVAATVAGGRLFYFVPSPVVEDQFELWTSDGTDAGTQALADGLAMPASLRACGDRIFFFNTAARQVWTSDGTFPGTKVVTTLADPQEYLLGAAVAGARYFFTTEKQIPSDEPFFFFKYKRRLLTSDGTPEGTSVLRDETHHAQEHLSQLVPSGDRLYYVGYSSQAGGLQVWSTDGSLAGTRITKVVVPNVFSILGPLKLTAAGGGQVVFFYDDRLWASDSTEAGTRALTDLDLPAGETFPLTSAGSLVYLERSKHGIPGWEITGFSRIRTASDSVTPLPATAEIGRNALLNGTSTLGDDWYLSTTSLSEPSESKLWRLPAGAQAPQLVKVFKAKGTTIYPPLGKVNQSLGVLGKTVVFPALTAKGQELWRSGGTAKSTRSVVKATDGSLTGFFETRGGKVYATRFDPPNGVELLGTNGGRRGTFIRPFLPGETYFGLGNEFFYGPLDQTLPQYLIRTNGTRKGTRPVLPGATPVVPPAQGHIFVNDTPGVGKEPWVSDGTREGTKLLADLFPGQADSLPKILGRAGNKTFFLAYVPGSNQSLHVTEGTPQTTHFVKDLSSIEIHSLLIRSFAAYQGEAYFVGRCLNVYGLWKSDGTETGTVLVKQLEVKGDPLDPYNAEVHGEEPCLTEAGGLLFFNARGAGGRELWKSDGTTAGTQPVADIRPGIYGSDPRNLYAANGKLYFSADDGTHGFEIWTSDGTAAGTQMVVDLTGDGLSSYPENFTLVGTKLYFFAQAPGVGRELHVID